MMKNNLRMQIEEILLEVIFDVARINFLWSRNPCDERLRRVMTWASPRNFL